MGCRGLLRTEVCNQPVLITDNTAPSLTCVNIFTPCTVDDEPPYRITIHLLCLVETLPVTHVE